MKDAYISKKYKKNFLNKLTYIKKKKLKKKKKKKKIKKKIKK